jgi:hypothetical protein
MLLQVHPIALGRDKSDKELHIWDPECGLEQYYNGVSTIDCDCQWGAGLVEDKVALILYLFDGDRTIEVYFTQNVAVGPNTEMNSWDVLFSMQPESLVLVYGEKPTDRDSWLRSECKVGHGLMESLDDFINKALLLSDEASPDPVLKEIVTYISVT